jgi:hypothetical protein
MSTIKADANMNIGICPECSSFTSFTITKKKNIFKCVLCLKNVEQYINGRIIYKTISVPTIEVKD